MKVEIDIHSAKVLYDEVSYVLFKLKDKYPQFGLNGTKNIWILKPSGSI